MKKQLNTVLQRVIDGVIDREGDYSNHPADKGGPTRFGITEGIAKAEGYHGDMRSLPRSLAFKIYADRYIIGPGFDRLFAVAPILAEELIDTGVNMGPVVAAKIYQRSLNVLNRQGRDYPDVAVDGRIGPATIAAHLALRKRRGADAGRVLFRLADGLQRARYAEICEGRRANEEFAFGWILNRTGDPEEFDK